MSVHRIARPVAASFPDNLTRAFAAAAERARRGPFAPDTDPAELQSELRAFDFTQPRPLEEIVNWVTARLEHGPAHTPVAIEQHIIRTMALRAGLPEDSAGHITADGSEANYTALICALTRADARFGDEGVRAFAGPVAVYVSRECQPSWHNIVHQAGIGRTALQLIATDGAGRMDVGELADTVREDRRRGTIPVLIAATAGTIGAGMIDPLEPCASIARECNIWYHVDAAYSGVALCSERLRGKLAGIELADSVTIDAHEWLAGTVGCSMFIAREPVILAEAFGLGGEVQCSRHLMALRFFVSLAAAGWQGCGSR